MKTTSNRKMDPNGPTFTLHTDSFHNQISLFLTRVEEVVVGVYSPFRCNIPYFHNELKEQMRIRVFSGSFVRRKEGMETSR